MSKHIITKGDIVSDLWRVVYFSDKGFESRDVQIFYKLAKESFEKLKGNLNENEVKIIYTQFEKAENISLPIERRREHVLTVAQILQ